MVGWLREIGPPKIGFLCTDNATAMRVAREQTVQTAGLTHIVELRWGLKGTTLAGFVTLETAVILECI
jgi:hypothetical protein